MANPIKKRHNAFDDFPITEEGGASQESMVSPSKVVPGQPAAPEVERIEKLHPSQMLPDRYQPRRLLPNSIRQPFFNGEITCYQAAEQWLALSKRDPAHKETVEKLLSMGLSFEEHGQIKPITGSWIQVSDGRYIFLIETGERRFWAACLQYIHRKMESEPALRVEVVKNPSRYRQVLENRHAEPPSAVSQACEVASLILSELNIQPDSQHGDDYDYFRSARNQRMPAGLWDRLTPLMQLTRPRMVQLLNILQLPTGMLEVADRYHVPERVLREILAAPRHQWEQMLLTSISENLTSDQISDMKNRAASPSSHPKPVPNNKPYLRLYNGFLKFSRSLRQIQKIDQAQLLDELADQLVVTKNAQDTIDWLIELARLLEIRLKQNR
ncbi:MAG TPA: hypothetical protein VIO61_17795 [Anaerolineaceae bacterium]